MAKKKVDKVIFSEIGGSWLKEPIKIDVYYDGNFFCYIPDELIGTIPSDVLSYRDDGKKNEKKIVQVIGGKDVTAIRSVLWQAYKEYNLNSVVEKKIIAFRFQFNSNKEYFNHSMKMSFCDTPALSLWYRVYYHVTFSDGREKIFSVPYKQYANLVSNKFDKDIDKFKDKWIDWTEEREDFFKSMVDSMENMIVKINTFFSKDEEEIALLVDSKLKLLK